MGLGNVRIALVGPLYGGNVGSVCRAMANTGLSDLAVVRRRDLDMNEARMMACHAGAVLDGRKEYDTFAEAISDCGMVVGTTARRGLYRSHAATPREWAPRILQVARNARVAVVFGPEDNGLDNDELGMCGHVIQIPATEECSSINLAQAVMICCYELFLAGGDFVPQEEKSPEATSELRERMFGMWRETMLATGFVKEDKADHMMYGLRRILARGAVTVDDVHIMMGLARQAVWAAGKSPEGRRARECAVAGPSAAAAIGD